VSTLEFLEELNITLDLAMRVGRFKLPFLSRLKYLELDLDNPILETNGLRHHSSYNRDAQLRSQYTIQEPPLQRLVSDQFPILEKIVIISYGWVLETMFKSVQFSSVTQLKMDYHHA
jgi:hypothetical protein